MKKNEDFLPKVSILISTKNRREDLQLAIASIKQMDYPKELYEIVVVEETNKPEPIEGVKYITIPEEGRGFGYSRNTAVKHASYPVVAFTDDDCQVERDWLRELVAPFQKAAAAVAGAVKVKNCGTLGYCENTLGFPGGGIKYIHRADNKIHPVKHISTCNAAFKKEIILKAGGFPLDTPFSGEDFLLAEKVSKSNLCYYNPKAIVYHKPRKNLWAIFKWFIRRGRSEMTVVDLADKKKGHIIWNLLTSITLRLIAVFAILIILRLNILLWLSILFLIYYILTVLRYSYSLKYYKNFKTPLYVPIVKLVMDCGMDVGRFLHLISKLSSAKKGNK
jgi:GT2 family glycosyltransferase